MRKSSPKNHAPGEDRPLRNRQEPLSLCPSSARHPFEKLRLRIYLHRSGLCPAESEDRPSKVSRFGKPCLGPKRSTLVGGLLATRQSFGNQWWKTEGCSSEWPVRTTRQLVRYTVAASFASVYLRPGLYNCVRSSRTIASNGRSN